jgi:hypothetical protein
MFPLKPKKSPIMGNKAKNAEAHTAPVKFGMGDYRGTGDKAPIGKLRSTTTGYNPVSKKRLGKPPKSTA